MEQLQVSQLGDIAGGINIEGGFPYYCLRKDNPYKSIIWANIGIIVPKKQMRDIANRYPMSENTIENINEHKMLSTYLMIVGYYLEHGRRLLDKTSNEKLMVTVHMHQDSSNIELLNILSDMINDLRKHFNMKNMILKYKTDQFVFNTHSHTFMNTDILISLSQCKMIDPYIRVGEFVIPEYWIPYEIKTKCVNIKNQYSAPNHLTTSINEILRSQYNDYSIKYVNSNYVSKNKTKNYDAYKLSVFDFMKTTILQVTNFWTPIDDTDFVALIR